jgi:AAA family ATP:ADP antiporter
LDAVAAPDAADRRFGLSPVERILRLFTEIRAGEGPTALVLFADVFLILCAYYFVKPLRDGWIAISDIGELSKMEVKAYTSFAQSLCLIGAVAVFAGLAARWSRRRLIAASTLFCMLNLVMFWLVRPRAGDTPSAVVGVAFYIWVGMFGVFVVAQFWAFAADLYTDERGRRLMPLIAIGATLGAATGSFLTGAVLRWVGDSNTLLLLATLPLATSILLTGIADARGPTGGGCDPGGRQPAVGSSAMDRHNGAWALVLRHPYLLAVAGITLLMNWVSTNGENFLFHVVQEALARELAAGGIADAAAMRTFVREGTTAFYGSFFFWVNICALGLQALVVSRLLKYGGFGATLLMLPLIALVTYSTIAFVPVLLLVRVMKTAENSTSYSINNTARHVLWLPTTAQLKYQAKPAIDTFVVRCGDGLAAATILVGVHLYALSIQTLLIFNVALVIGWLTISGFVIRGHGQLVREHQQEEVTQSAA